MKKMKISAVKKGMSSRFRSVREGDNLSQSELADTLRVTRKEVRMWENQDEPHVPNLEQMQRWLECRNGQTILTSPRTTLREGLKPSKHTEAAWIRLKANMTQLQAADLLGLRLSDYRRLESDRTYGLHPVLEAKWNHLQVFGESKDAQSSLFSDLDSLSAGAGEDLSFPEPEPEPEPEPVPAPELPAVDPKVNSRQVVNDQVVTVATYLVSSMGIRMPDAVRKVEAELRNKEIAAEQAAAEAAAKELGIVLSDLTKSR